MRSYEVVPFQLAPWSVEFLLDVAAVGALDEVHVLEQVRHAGLAVAFVPGADEIGDVDRDRVAAGVGQQQDAEPVGVRYSVIPAIAGPFLTPGGSV